MYFSDKPKKEKKKFLDKMIHLLKNVLWNVAVH